MATEQNLTIPEKRFMLTAKTMAKTKPESELEILDVQNITLKSVSLKSFSKSSLGVLLAQNSHLIFNISLISTKWSRIVIYLLFWLFTISLLAFGVLYCFVHLISNIQPRQYDVPLKREVVIKNL